MAAYQSTKHEATGYTTNHFVFGRKVHASVNIVFENPNDEPPEDYDTFVKNAKKSLLQLSLRFDFGLKPKTFKIGIWVMYINPRKLRGRQKK